MFQLFDHSDLLPIWIRLPCGRGARWAPGAANSLIGKTTDLELDGCRERVRITDAHDCDDPQYLEIKLEVIETRR